MLRVGQQPLGMKYRAKYMKAPNTRHVIHVDGQRSMSLISSQMLMSYSSVPCSVLMSLVDTL